MVSKSSSRAAPPRIVPSAVFIELPIKCKNPVVAPHLEDFQIIHYGRLESSISHREDLIKRGTEQSNIVFTKAAKY